jgi:hypothetical protein
VRATSGTHLAETPLTGKPDAGNPPVRFGGRGEVNPSSLPLSNLPWQVSMLFFKHALGRPGAARAGRWTGLGVLPDLVFASGRPIGGSMILTLSHPPSRGEHLF